MLRSLEKLEFVVGSADSGDVSNMIQAVERIFSKNRGSSKMSTATYTFSAQIKAFLLYLAGISCIRETVTPNY
jgi:hypothetical protein